MSIEILNPILTPVKPDLGIKDRIDLWSATRLGSGDKAKELSKKRWFALKSTLGLALLGACGGATTGEPTTQPTVIESTTTLPPSTLPTTEATTTTIPVTSPTVPEATTTTEGIVEIYEPRGEVNVPKSETPVGYGVIPGWGYSENEYQANSLVSGLITNAYQEENTWYLNYVAGKDVNNEWVIGTMELAENEYYLDIGTRTGSSLVGNGDGLYITTADAVEKIQTQLKEKGAFQAVFNMYSHLSYDFYKVDCEYKSDNNQTQKELIESCNYFTDFVEDGIHRNNDLLDVLQRYSYMDGDNVMYRPISEEDALFIESTIGQVWEFTVFGPASQYFK